MDSENVVSPEFGPGRLLTDARLKLGLEQENVAEMLHLRVHQIRALEADDYDNLPEPTYVKGYLRAYCQLLALNADEIVGQYTRYANPPVKESYEVLVSEKQAVSSDNLIKLASVALVALIAGLAVVYWMTAADKDMPQELAATPLVDQAPGYTSGYAGDNNAGAQLPPVGANATGEMQNPVVTGNQGVAGGATTPSAPAPVSAQAPTVKSVGTISGGPASGSATANPAVSPALAAPAPGVSKPAVPVQQPGTVVVNAKPVVTQPIARQVPIEAVRSRLVIKTANTSWIDVRDSYDNKLIYETVPAGRVIPLEGVAPFKIFLGNAEGVQIYVEEKEFNFTRFKRGQTARFSVNVEEGNR